MGGQRHAGHQRASLGQPPVGGVVVGIVVEAIGRVPVGRVLAVEVGELLVEAGVAGLEVGGLLEELLGENGEEL